MPRNFLPLGPVDIKLSERVGSAEFTGMVVAMEVQLLIIQSLPIFVSDLDPGTWNLRHGKERWRNRVASRYRKCVTKISENFNLTDVLHRGVGCRSST